MPEASSAGYTALEADRWADARAAFESALTAGETPDACLGLATALWWLGESHASVAQGTRAYALFRRRGATETAVRCAVWLGIPWYTAEDGSLHAPFDADLIVAVR